MKKIVAVLLAAMLTAGVLAGCNNADNNSSSGGESSSSSSSQSTSNELKEGTTLEDVIKKVNEEFGENGAVMMPGQLEEAMLTDQYGIDPADVEEFYGEFSMSMTNSDHLIAIKAKDGKIDAIKEGLEKRKADLEAQYETYPVNGSYDRAKAAKVYVRGNYAFLIGVGVLPDDPDADPNFEEQVQKAQDAIDSMFA